MKGVSMEENKKHLNALKQILSRPENRVCCDCVGGGAAARPTWASINIGNHEKKRRIKIIKGYVMCKSNLVFVFFQILTFSGLK